MSEVNRYTPSMRVGHMVKDKDGLWNRSQDFDRVATERDALQALLTAADERLDAAVNLLEVWRTWLGPTRESCDETGKKVWDRIDAVTALKLGEGGGDD